MIGRSSILKGLWITGYIFVQGVVRPRRIKTSVLDGWTLVNIAFQAVAMLVVIRVGGFAPFKYLLASTVFAIGLHPLGGRWIQEHFAFAPDQETYSYYGPMNRLAFNVGYHNEHHDLVTVPWMRLPEIRRAAPEFYDGLASYQSWSGVLFQFVSNPSFSLFSYIVRPDVGRAPASPNAARFAASASAGADGAAAQSSVQRV
jgi:sphingolipid delta-4 desaturase